MLLTIVAIWAVVIPLAILGVTWQTARGLISTQVDGVIQPIIQIQVYAAVYQGKPYIIGIFAAAGVSSLADKVYFQPMRESFEFLPVAA